MSIVRLVEYKWMENWVVFPFFRNALLDAVQGGQRAEGHARAAGLKKLVGEPWHLALNELFTKIFIKVSDLKPGLGHPKRCLLEISDF